MRYYSILRPIGPGTFPGKPDSITNFDNRTYCDDIGREAWGYLEYNEPLDDKDAAAYDLVPAKAKTKMLLLDVNNNEARIVEAETLQDFYQLIGCRLVDIVSRNIGHKRFSIICDQEGLFEDCPKVSAISESMQVMFVGNLLIAGDVDYDGEMESLSDEDIDYIDDKLKWLHSRILPEPILILTQCEY